MRRSEAAAAENPSLLPIGRGRSRVLDALRTCETFDDVKAAGFLFHGTCETIDGDLRGGGYDEVFWTADRPSIAQAYIPKAGVQTWIHAPYPDDRDRPIQPSQRDCAVMSWALQRSGATREDLDITWNGHRPYSWSVPEGWPTEGDLNDWRQELGYRSRNGAYTVSLFYGPGGIEEIKPDAWRLPGTLLICLPDPAVRLTHPAWSDDALGYAPHNRTGDFARMAAAGLPGFRMHDQLQSDHLGNVGHAAYGFLPAGIAQLDWIAIPATRHDGTDPAVFDHPETPAFVAFMRDLNPSYRPSEPEGGDLCCGAA